MHSTIGYHTVGDWNNIDYVRENAPFECTRADAWLSHGYYFWEDDLDQAHTWGRVGQQGRYIIYKADLQLSNMLDLLANREHQLYLKELMRIFKEEHSELPAGYDPSISEVIAYFRIVNLKRDPGIFSFDSVRAYDIPFNKTPYKFVSWKDYTTYLDMRIQICLFNIMDGHLQSFSIVYPERYI